MHEHQANHSLAEDGPSVFDWAIVGRITEAAETLRYQSQFFTSSGDESPLIDTVRLDSRPFMSFQLSNHYDWWIVGLC